jgi:hypothetical protein
MTFKLGSTDSTREPAGPAIGAGEGSASLPNAVVSQSMMLRTRRWFAAPELSARLRSIGLPLVLVAGALFFGAIVNGHVPIRDWLFFRYAKAWVLALYWFMGCLSAGYAVVRRLGPRLPISEQLVLAAPTGVYLSYVTLFAGGLVGLFRQPVFAVLLPAVLIAAGARWSFPLMRRLGRHFDLGQRRARSRTSLPEWLLNWAVITFGLVCLGLAYLTILTPDNASFDAIYYHLGLAEQYKVKGGIAPSPEGWVVEALPLLGSTIYAWAFIFPSNDLFDAMMVCAHLEYVFFLATLAGLPVAVRCLVPRARSATAWVALFLFPSIIVYDAGLHSGNDHIAAFFALPLWIAAHRSFRALEPGRLALFSIMAASALLTKYQCAAIVLAPTLALVGRAAWLGVRGRSIHAGRGVAVALAVGVVATAPHWLKNWLWFGDPLFPALHRHLDVHPWYPGAGEIIEWNYKRVMALPHGTLGEQLWQIVRGAFQFGFRPETGFHRDWPIFGPLFTLSLTWLLFLRGAGRLWLLAGATQCGLFFWYFFSYYERYMQPLVPWMAAVVAGCIVLIARRGWAARAALAALLGLVLVWGGDAYFIPHWLLKDSTIRVSASLLGAAYRGDAAARQKFRSPHKEIGEALPPDAHVLLHEQQLRLGLARPVVQDFAGFQTRFSYEQMGSAREVYDLYRELGVTHMIWEHQKAARVDSLAGDLRFWQFATHHTRHHRRFGNLTVAEVAAEAPPPSLPGHVERVAYLSCDRSYAPGLYPVSLMNTHGGDGRRVPPPIPAPDNRDDLVAFTQDAAFIVVDPRCTGKQWPIPKQVFDPFVRAARRGPEELWVRKREASAP